MKTPSLDEIIEQMKRGTEAMKVATARMESMSRRITEQNILLIKYSERIEKLRAALIEVRDDISYMKNGKYVNLNDVYHELSDVLEATQ